MKRILLSLLLFSVIPAHGILKPSFNDSMTITHAYAPERAALSPLWVKTAQLYTNAGFDCPPAGAPRTPHIIHHIWLGSTLPEVCAMFRQSWIDNHPSWTHILWTDNVSNYNDTDLIVTPESLHEIHDLLQQQDLPPKIIVNVKHLQFSTLRQYQASKNYGEKSDILRYEILFLLGGLYVDTDFKCIHPFDDVHQACNFFAGLNFSDKEFNIFNGLIGTAPQHAILKSCIKKIRQQTLKRDDLDKNNILKRVAIMKRTGPYFFSNIISEYIMSLDEYDPIVLFPVSFLYPYPHMDLKTYRNHSISQLESTFLKPESIAIHFWHVSWDPKKE